jgi:hypothetical protein
MSKIDDESVFLLGISYFCISAMELGKRKCDCADDDSAKKVRVSEVCQAVVSFGKRLAYDHDDCMTWWKDRDAAVARRKREFGRGSPNHWVWYILSDALSDGITTGRQVVRSQGCILEAFEHADGIDDMIAIAVTFERLAALNVSYLNAPMMAKGVWASIVKAFGSFEAFTANDRENIDRDQLRKTNTIVMSIPSFHQDMIKTLCAPILDADSLWSKQDRPDIIKSFNYEDYVPDAVHRALQEYNVRLVSHKGRLHCSCKLYVVFGLSTIPSDRG